MIKSDEKLTTSILFKLVNGESLTAQIDPTDFKISGNVVILKDSACEYTIPLSSIVYIREDFKEEETDDQGN